MYWFGRLITEYLGQNKLLGLYVWGGISGGLFYLLIYNIVFYFSSVIEYSALLGASGGVGTIVVGAATFQPNYAVYLIFLGSLRMKYIAAFYVITSFLQSTGANAGGEIAHLGGALVGYLMITQLQKGNDWSKPIVNVITWLKGLFIPTQDQGELQKRQKQKARSKKASKAKKSASVGTSSNISQDEIDAILDKISEKGYDALSKDEKQKLFNASKD